MDAGRTKAEHTCKGGVARTFRRGSSANLHHGEGLSESLVEVVLVAGQVRELHAACRSGNEGPREKGLNWL